jgi:DNA adenine methylase
MKTFYRWPGNKMIHAPKITRFFPENYNTYFEPFLGSGAIFLSLQPKKWVINDINQDVYNIWNQVQNKYNLFIKQIKLFVKTFKSLSIEDKKQFAKTNIANLNKTNDFTTTKRAVYYIMLKYIAYLGHIFVKNEFRYVGIENNLYKQNSPYYMTEKYLKNLENVHQYLNSSTGSIYNDDYAVILKKTRKGDFVFLDPPYYEPNVNYQFNYNKNEVVNELFLKELAKNLKTLDKKGVKWLMTQSDIPDIYKVFKEYNFEKITVYRRQKDAYVHELLIRNY